MSKMRTMKWNEMKWNEMKTQWNEILKQYIKNRIL